MSTSAIAANALEPSASTPSARGTALVPPEKPPVSGATAAEVLTADEELQRDWEVFGLPELYEAPTEQERPLRLARVSQPLAAMSRVRGAVSATCCTQRLDDVAAW